MELQYHFYNPRPDGKKIDDCVRRAICATTRLPYSRVKRGLEKYSTRALSYQFSQVFDKYLKELGFIRVKFTLKNRRPRTSDLNTLLEGTENESYKIIVVTYNHAVGLICADGIATYEDLFDDTKEDYAIIQLWIAPNDNNALIRARIEQNWIGMIK